MRDTEKIIGICGRIERALQRDWGGTGKGMIQKLNSSKYTVPPQLHKRIRFLNRMLKRATRESGFKLKSSEDFLAKGEQLIEELAQARKTAPRRLLPWLLELPARYRVITGTTAVALVATLASLYFFYLREPVPVPVAAPVPAPKPAPRPVPKPAPKPAPAPATAATSAPAPLAQASAPAPVVVPVPVPAAAPAEPEFTDAKVHIEAPSQVTLTLKRAELVKGTSGRDEIAVIVEVQNLGYESLKRITFDAWLYDTSGARPVAVIAPSAQDAAPWHAFLRLAIKRGQSVEVRLGYSLTSAWAADPAVALVNSGRYQIRLKAVSLIDGSDSSLPL